MSERRGQAVFTFGDCRATVYVPEGGSLFEVRVDGPGWIVCEDWTEWEAEDRETPDAKAALAAAEAFRATLACATCKGTGTSDPEFNIGPNCPECHEAQ